MKNNTLKAMGIAVGAALSLMYATGMEVQAEELEGGGGGSLTPSEAVEQVVTKEEVTLPEGYDEVADEIDYNDDGDTKDTCTVEEVPGAIEEIEKGSLQVGDEGLTDPVKVAEVEEYNHIGDNLTEDEKDGIVSDLKDQYDEDEIIVSKDEESFNKAIDEAYDELKKDFTDEQITKSEDEDGNVILDGKKTEPTPDDDSLKNLTEKEKDDKIDELIKDGYDPESIKEEKVEDTDKKDEIIADLKEEGFTDEDINVKTDEDKNISIDASRSEAEQTVSNAALAGAIEDLKKLGYTEAEIKVDQIYDEDTLTRRTAELEKDGYTVTATRDAEGKTIGIAYAKTSVEQSKVDSLVQSITKWDSNNQATVKEGDVTYIVTKQTSFSETETGIEEGSKLDKEIKKLKDKDFINGVATIIVEGKEYRITRTELSSTANINNFSGYNFICNELVIGYNVAEFILRILMV